MRRLAPLAALLGLATGCFQLPDDWINNSITQALDYHVDRPRVLAVTTSPTLVQPGIPVTVDALIVAPPDHGIPALRLATCGLQSDVPVNVLGLSCFDNPDLVQEIATDLPHVWRVPELDVDCESQVVDTGYFGNPCASRVPLLVEGLWKDGVASDERAYGHLALELQDVEIEDDDAPPPLVGQPQELSSAGEPRPGADVQLAFQLLDPDVQDVHWYVDAGELLGTGRTLFQQDERTGWRISQNTLRIPDDHDGPLRVWAVVSRDRFARRQGDSSWQSLTLEVP